MTPALHPDAARLLEMMRAAGRPPFEQLTTAQARAAYIESRAALQPPPAPVAATADITIPGPGGPLPLRTYRGLGTDDTTLPGLLYLHGGGWVLGGLDSHDAICRRLANAASCRVIAVEYRLAPEHPFPAAVDDAVAALVHVAAHAAAFQIDPARLAAGGDSAGANLAAVLALTARDGAAPALAAQLLFYPVTDFAMDTPSYAAMTTGLPLTAATMRWFTAHYAPDARDWRAAPARAQTLRGTPPAFILTCGQDPLADEGQDYATRLEADAVLTTALHMPGHVHGFLTMGGIIPQSDSVLAFAGQWLADILRPGAEQPFPNH